MVVAAAAAVRYWLQRRREKRYRRAGMQTLTPEQLDALVEYINKATGWLFVALGGLLLAVKETAAVGPPPGRPSAR